MCSCGDAKWRGSATGRRKEGVRTCVEQQEHGCDCGGVSSPVHGCVQQHALHVGLKLRQAGGLRLHPIPTACGAWVLVEIRDRHALHSRSASGPCAFSSSMDEHSAARFAAVGA